MASRGAVLHTPHFIRLHVFGTRRWVEILNDTHPDTPGGKVRMLTAESGQPTRQTDFDWDDSVTANIEAFARAARGEAEYPFTTEQMVHNIQILEAIARSAETGQAVLLADV